jgi:hypothetical protein
MKVRQSMDEQSVKGEIIEDAEVVEQEKHLPAPAQFNYGVTREAVDEMATQRSILREFVSSQLVQASFEDQRSEHYGSGDFGIIPGTKKKTLLKPGAEKLLRLFRLGARFELVDKVIDHDRNFAMFTYKCIVYSLTNDKIIAECDGSVNSQEKKYATKTEWREVPGSKPIKEVIVNPIYEILNTLQKMAQKRALLAATIIATGASEYFTQDMHELKDNAAAKGKFKAPPTASKPVSPNSGATVSPTSTITPDEGGSPPEHCGRSMVVSKYLDKQMGHFPWYCIKCGFKEARE